MLSEKDKELLLFEFPKQMKLSYKTPYKKVLKYDLIYAIPEGQSAYVWFTNYNNRDLCVILELENCENRKIKNIYIQRLGFHYELCFGTIFYGTIFYYKGHKHFSLEDMFYYKGKNVSQKKLSEKINIYNILFEQDISMTAYNKHFLVIGLPLMCLQNEDIYDKIKLLPYKIKYLEYHYFHHNSSIPILYINYSSNKNNISNYNLFNNHNKVSNNQNISNNYTKASNNNVFNNHNKVPLVFQVRPDIQNDIYHLYTHGDIYHSTAFIPDYITSVLMNNLFRNIKENINLDTLEESDDEEDFQNNNIDKYVFLERIINMFCKYSYKFKKWVPYKVADPSMKIVNKDQLGNI